MPTLPRPPPRASQRPICLRSGGVPPALASGRLAARRSGGVPPALIAGGGLVPPGRQKSAAIHAGRGFAFSLPIRGTGSEPLLRNCGPVGRPTASLLSLSPRSACYRTPPGNRPAGPEPGVTARGRQAWHTGLPDYPGSRRQPSLPTAPYALRARKRAPTRRPTPTRGGHSSNDSACL